MIIDCRSDTVTKPSSAMRKAMAEAEVGDDVFREDPTVHQLESKMAKVLGKEAGLFVPTGSMGNLISVMVHCWGRGQEIILGDRSHIHLYEQGTIAQFGGVHHRALKNNDDGTFNIEDMQNAFRRYAPDDPHEPITSLVCIENSHNKCGGRTLPLAWIDQLAMTCKEYNLPLHCDGARLFNSALALKVPASRLVKDCDSVSVCLSKGLGAPVGSVIVGSKGFIAKAIRVRKALGGGLRQVGVLAAAGLYALNNNVERLQRDHENAMKVAQVISQYGKGVMTLNKSTVNTNLVFAKVLPNVMTPEAFVDRMAKTSDAQHDAAEVKIIDMGKETVRISFHLDVTDTMTDVICNKLRFVFDEIRLNNKSP